MDAQDYLCKALELAGQANELFEKSVAGCEDALGLALGRADANHLCCAGRTS